VAERPDGATSTCQVRPVGGRLPDPNALVTGLDGLALGAALRGVEAEANGWVAEVGGDLYLLMEGTGETARLAPLRRKVQSDRAGIRPAPATPSERTAYARLHSSRAWQLRPVRVAGPLTTEGSARRLTLEVRTFAWRR
jgi:hypothetical protein